MHYANPASRYMYSTCHVYVIVVCAGAVALGAGAAVLLKPKLVQKLDAADAAGGDDEEEHLLVNWSGTHECRPRVLAQPENLEELEALVAGAHAAGAKP